MYFNFSSTFSSSVFINYLFKKKYRFFYCKYRFLGFSYQNLIRLLVNSITAAIYFLFSIAISIFSCVLHQNVDSLQYFSIKLYLIDKRLFCVVSIAISTLFLSKLVFPSFFYMIISMFFCFFYQNFMFLYQSLEA